MVLIFQKYGKFWSISRELFIKHNPWNCEEWENKEAPRTKELLDTDVDDSEGMNMVITCHSSWR